ncbi:MAG: NB-ARC domain-containing protein [Chloroflexota bacterium]
MHNQTTVENFSQLTKGMSHALRNYRRAYTNKENPLAALAIVQQKLSSIDLLKSSESRDKPVQIHWAICRVLEDCLAELETQDAELADLMRQRFFKGRSVQDMAVELALSDSSIFYRQKRAIRLLTDILLTQENRTNQAQTAVQSPVHAPPPEPVAGEPASDESASDKPTTEPLPAQSHALPPSTYAQLFGIDKQRQLLQDNLSTHTDPWILSIVGMGGVGKTTLAHVVSSWVAHNDLFEHIVWLTTKQVEYDVYAGTQRSLTSPDSRPAQNTVSFTYDKFLDAVISELGLASALGIEEQVKTPERGDGALPENTQKKQERLRVYLSEHPTLIVIDNLESVADYKALVRDVRGLINPSKVIVTSRYSVNAPGAMVLRIGELGDEDALALLRFEAQQRGLDEVAMATDDQLQPIYELVGGNPLALKLVVGQLLTLPLREVLARLKQARKVNERTEYELYYYLYSHTWTLLSDDARELMLTMPVFPSQGGTWDELLVVSGLERTQLGPVLKELVARSLLNTGGWPDKIYSIHRLTHTFLMTDVLKWW